MRVKLVYISVTALAGGILIKDDPIQSTVTDTQTDTHTDTAFYS